MKQAILVVAFGTTVASARQNQINPVVEFIKTKYKDLDVRLAFTSRIIVKRLRERGEMIDTEQSAIEALIEEGYESIIVQPLHLIGGEEFDKLKQNILAYQGQGSLQHIAIGRPLLYFLGQEERPDDYEALIETFIKTLPIPKEEGLVLVGHGGMSVGNASYSALQLKLLRKGYHHVRITTLECFPELDDVIIPWEWLDGKRPGRIHIHPLLLVAGDHALHDIFGDDEESVQSTIESAGYEVVRHMKGLGEYRAIQQLYCDHLSDAIAGRYEGRVSHRPSIPNIK
ncbi:sirohydrochlorin cobaltochelatase [Veillonella criceti]|uniref:Sirohydrochlorin cobaltochelatase n=1 Tax=Veillonella criceti TaxID=103891 RepID=A0A380NH76_9FIRM|nr:sirohydrochlorin cobaltochelatase [Veillonella criceti]SUP39584.1 Sirohydrochlorin cobaltochelatase [Veillonella criceti]